VLVACSGREGDGVNIKEALQEMRSGNAQHLEWADAIEAAMRDKDEELDFLRSVKESRGKELDEKDAEIEHLNKMLRHSGYGQGEIDAYTDQCDEIERLREALNRCAGYDCWHYMRPDDKQFVKAALAGKEPRD